MLGTIRNVSVHNMDMHVAIKLIIIFMDRCDGFETYLIDVEMCMTDDESTDNNFNEITSVVTDYEYNNGK